ncbi:MAG: glycosyl hydrolase [Proteobacteria bacterium]|nr:glycosyl hydrolase [Pseudomonadota bacterium]NOG59587.1 glycosyl hydrolase [Pseudomonadota bacterium]
MYVTRVTKLIHKLFFLRIWLILSVLCGTACEAPLNLEGVKAQSHQSILRFDHYQAAATNNDSIVVVGSAGVVLVSTDKGESWSRQILSDYPALIDVVACPDSSYVALDFNHNIWSSNDNARTWNKRSIDSTEVPQAITCDPDNKIWVVASFSTILNSPDQGDTWESISMDEDLMLTSIQFIDEQTVFVTGEFGTVLKSSNAGKTWDYMEPLPGGFYPQASYFMDSENGWVVGLRGKVFYTNDGSNSWQLQPTDIDIPLYGVMAGESKVYAVGDTGKVLEYDNGQWQQLSHDFPIRFYLRAVLQLNDKSILLAGGAGALHKYKFD